MIGHGDTASAARAGGGAAPMLAGDRMQPLHPKPDYPAPPGRFSRHWFLARTPRGVMADTLLSAETSAGVLYDCVSAGKRAADPIATPAAVVNDAVFGQTAGPRP